MKKLMQSERTAALYASFISAGFTLHIVNNTLTIQPNERVTPPLQRWVDLNKDKLIQHIRSLPK